MGARLLTHSLLLAIIAFADLPIASEQQVEKQSEQSKTLCRVEYSNSPDLPDGIAFYMLLRMLEHNRAEYGADDSAVWVADVLRMNKDRSLHFVSRVPTILESIEQEENLQVREHSCQFAGPAVSRKDKYAALQQTYTVQTAIRNNHYERFRAEFDSATQELLQSWIDEQKLSIGHCEIDFEGMDKQLGRDSTQTLARLCSNNDGPAPN